MNGGCQHQKARTGTRATVSELRRRVSRWRCGPKKRAMMSRFHGAALARLSDLVLMYTFEQWGLIEHVAALQCRGDAGGRTILPADGP